MIQGLKALNIAKEKDFSPFKSITREEKYNKKSES